MDMVQCMVSWDKISYTAAPVCHPEEKSQKDRVLTASKTMWMLTSWHKTLVPALGS